jgi:serine/threonine protein kinase
LSAEASATLAEGRYRLIEVIGSGGMATVYRAFDGRLQVPRAIKILLPALANRERLRARFEAEARTMALLEHRNIVRVYDVGSDGNLVYIVMELVEGGSLVDRLEANGPLPARQAVDVCLHVLAGLAVSHSRNIIHRDIKPHNVLLTSDGEVRVTDFGIARLAESNDNLTKTGAIMGTWGFMAPEQRADSKGVDARADLYAVAATLYSCVTNETPMDLFAAELDSSMLARVPEALAEVIRKATRYDREERYADTAAMAAALHEIRDRLPPLPAGTPALAVPPSWTKADPELPSPRPLAESPSDEPGSQDTIQPSTRDHAEDGEAPTPTMVPDRTPPPPSRGNFTFDALGGETSIEELERRAVEASREGAAAPGRAPVRQAVVPEEPDFLDTAPPKRRRIWPWALGILVLVGAPAALAIGGLARWAWEQPQPTASTEPPLPTPQPEPTPEPVEPPPPEPGEPGPEDPGATVVELEPQDAEPLTRPPDRPPRPTPVPEPPPPEPIQEPVVRPAPEPALEPAPEPEVQPAPEPAAAEGPRLVHTPIGSVSADSIATISAKVTGGRYKVTLYYRPAASGSAYQAKVMVLRGDAYQAKVNVDASFGAGLEYHIKAAAEEPGLENLSSGSGFRPHRASVQ